MTIAGACAALLVVAPPVQAKPASSCGRLTVSKHTYTVWEHNNGCTFARKAVKLFLTKRLAVSGYRCNRSAAGSNVPFLCVSKRVTRDSKSYYAVRR
jgi:hypothetical protein